MLRIRVSTASAEITETELITAGRVGLQCAFEFNDAWDGLAKTVVIHGGVKRYIVLVGNTILVPGECLARENFPLRIGVYGQDGSGNIVIPTIWVNFGKIRPSAGPIVIPEITPNVAAQIQYNSSEALRIAQEIQEKADNGEFNGRDGATGPRGEDGTDGQNGNSIWTTTETPMPASGGVVFTQLTGRSGIPPVVGDVIVRSSRYVYQIVEVTVGGTVIASLMGDIKGEQGVADAIWRTTASIGSVYPSGYVVNVSDLVGRSGATPKAGDLVIGPESGQTGDPTYLYAIIGVGSSVAGLDGIGSMKLTYADLTAADKADLVQGPILSAQNTAVAAVNAAGANQVDAVEDKGEEVLASIPQDYSALSGEVDDLKSALTVVGGETGVLPILDLESGYITNSGAIGSTVSYTVTAHSGFVHTVVDCSGVKEIIISGYGWTTARLWCFVDSDDKIIANSAASVNASETPLRLLVPNDAAKCIINSYAQYFGGIYAISEEPNTDNAELKIDYLSEQIRLHSAVRSSENLFDPTADWSTINGCEVTSARDAVTITTVAAGTYQYAKCAVDVAGVSKITASYGNVDGTGDAFFRIVVPVSGRWTPLSAETSISNKAYIYDVSSYDTVYVLINVTTGTSKPAGTYLTYHNIQVQAGTCLTEYIPNGYFKINSFEDETARSAGVVEASKNLINKFDTWYSNGTAVEIQENGDIKVISTAAGNFQYAYVLFDASMSRYFISQHEFGETTGEQLFRIGYLENGSITFKTAPTRIWDLENHPVGVLALYVTVNTSKPKGTYAIYKNVLVTPGMVDIAYSEYGEDVMRNRQLPCFNSIVKTIAHRGDFFLAPQCTAPAYIEARKRGLTIAENDLNKTADGTYVMWHETSLINCGLLVDINGYEMYTDGSEFYYYDRANDKLYTFTTDYVESSVSVSSLTRCDGTDYEISAMNYSVLKRVDCGVYRGSMFKGTTILTFEEWVALCRTLGMDIHIDRKVAWTDAEAQTLVGIVKKYSMLDHATWNTGNAFLTECIRHYDPNARICLLTWPTSSLMSDFSSFNTGRGVVFNGDIKSIDKDAIRLGLDAGFQVEGWYVDFWLQKNKQQALAIIRDAVDAGCQAITTDHYRVDEAYGELYGMYD